MIDNVPLIQNANDVQQINASIIAMKKASRELDEKIVKLNSLNSELDKKIALLDSGLNKEIEDRKEAINSLDVSSVGGSGKYISAISETDGKISATASDITSTVSSGNSQPVTSGGVAEAIGKIIYDDTITDCNNAFEVGKTKTYWLSNNRANIPNTTHSWYILSQCNPSTISPNSYVTQIATPSDNNGYNELYIRHRYVSSYNPITMSWTSWQKVTCLKEKQIRIDDNSGYSLYNGVYVKSISNFFADNGIDYSKVINIRQVNNGNDLYPYFFIGYGWSDILKVFKFSSQNNVYVDIKVYYE